MGHRDDASAAARPLAGAGAHCGEASSPYAYMRQTTEGRIVFGGEDEEIRDAGQRDALLQPKIDLLRAKLRDSSRPPTRRSTRPGQDFSETSDGLPLIGAVPGMPRCFAAFGYGGNASPSAPSPRT